MRSEGPESFGFNQRKPQRPTYHCKVQNSPQHFATAAPALTYNSTAISYRVVKLKTAVVRPCAFDIHRSNIIYRMRLV